MHLARPTRTHLRAVKTNVLHPGVNHPRLGRRHPSKDRYHCDVLGAHADHVDRDRIRRLHRVFCIRDAV